MDHEQLNDRIPLAVLMVEDSDDDSRLNQLELRRGGFAVSTARVQTLAEVREQLQAERWDIVLTDHALPGFSSAEVLDIINMTGQDTPCIIVSGAIGEDAAVRLLQSGAIDYVNKSRLGRLVPAVSRALEEAADRRARKQAEASLRELNENLEQRVAERTREVLSQSRLLEVAVNTMKDVFYVTDPDLRLVRWNRELRSVSGQTDERLENLSLAGLFHEEDQPDLQAWVSSVREEGSATTELRLRNKDGVYIPYELNGAWLQAENGEPDGICGIAHNVTGRRQIEYRLKEAIRAVIQDATWFAQSVLDKMNQVDAENVPLRPGIELTDRETDVLERLAMGARNDQIASELGISYSTVRNYVARLYEKLGVHSRAEAVVWARERGFGQGGSDVLP